MYWLNRLRGTYLYYSKVIAILLGVIFGLVASNYYIGIAVAVGYLAGESMGWGEWIGGLINGESNVPVTRNGTGNGIEWLATRFYNMNTFGYHFLALAIRGFYWWFLTLMSLMLYINPIYVCLSILILSIGFPVSVVLAKKYIVYSDKTVWEFSEDIYGLFQDVVLISIIVYYFLTKV